MDEKGQIALEYLILTAIILAVAALFFTVTQERSIKMYDTMNRTVYTWRDRIGGLFNA